MPATETRVPALTTRQVVGRRLPGAIASSEIRALLIGARIDTRDLPEFVDAEELGLGTGGVAFVFPFGVVVLFGATDETERRIVGA